MRKAQRRDFGWALALAERLLRLRISAKLLQESNFRISTMPRSEHTTNRNGTSARATRARTDEKRRPAPAASTTRRRGAEKTEAATKNAQTKAAATKATTAKKAPAKKRLPKN